MVDREAKDRQDLQDQKDRKDRQDQKDRQETTAKRLDLPLPQLPSRPAVVEVVIA